MERLNESKVLKAYLEVKKLNNVIEEWKIRNNIFSLANTILQHFTKEYKIP